MTASKTVRVAAVQPALRLGAVEDNLVRLEGLIRDAVREHQPAIVTVPEAATSPNVYAAAMRGVVRPIDGAPLQLYRQLARELDVVVGGGFLARRGRDAYGTYVLAEPDGRVHLHDKDIPTMWEHNYYRGGADPGHTSLAALDGAPVGVANGWEWARHRTAARLRRHRVQVLLGGMCWPSYPTNWAGPAGWWTRREHALQLQHARELPRQMARLLGAPVVMPSHVGPVDFDTPLAPGLPWRTLMLGETQIVERDGTILARLSADDGEGHVGAEITLAEPAPLDPVSDLYWIPPMSVTTRAAWVATNTHGSVKYQAMRTLRRHPWQHWPGGDLPDEGAPANPAEQLHAATGTATQQGDPLPATTSLPHVEPHARQGLLYRAYIAFLSTSLGRWIVINVASKIDPWLMKVSKGKVHSGVVLPSALLETRGARSGISRSNAVLYFHDGDRPVIIASSLGRAKHPAWYHNLRAHPNVHLGGSAFRAEIIEDEQERDRLWGLADRVYPPYAAYRRMTRDVGRRIPIIRLGN